MTTQQMIEAIQEKIGDKTISNWCMAFINWELYQYYNNWFTLITDKSNKFWYISDIEYIKKEEIIWHPVSLARVLNALGEEHCYWSEWIYKFDQVISAFVPEWAMIEVCNRNLLNKDWSDCMLQDQEEETIEALYNIICK